MLVALPVLTSVTFDPRAVRLPVTERVLPAMYEKPIDIVELAARVVLINPPKLPKFNVSPVPTCKDPKPTIVVLVVKALIVVAPRLLVIEIVAGDVKLRVPNAWLALKFSVAEFVNVTFGLLEPSALRELMLTVAVEMVIADVLPKIPVAFKLITDDTVSAPLRIVAPVMLPVAFRFIVPV